MIAHFLNGQDIFLIMHVNVVAINLSMYLYINMELKSFFPQISKHHYYTNQLYIIMTNYYKNLRNTKDNGPDYLE